MEWSGEIEDPSMYTKEVLDKSLQKTNFFVEHSSYINRKGQFPDDLILDGRESVGAIAIKTEK